MTINHDSLVNPELVDRPVAPIRPFVPLTNVTPFTYRDGSTYLEVLERLRSFINQLIENATDQNATINEVLQAQNDKIEELLGQLIGYTIEIDEFVYRASMMDGTIFEAYTIGGVDRELTQLRDHIDDVVENLLQVVSDLSDDVTQLRNDVTDQLAQFRDEINTQLNEFRNAINTQLDEFEDRVNTQLYDLEGSLDSSRKFVAHTLYDIGNGTGSDYEKVQAALNDIPEGYTLTIPEDLTIPLAGNTIEITRSVGLRGGRYTKSSGGNTDIAIDIQANDVTLENVTIVGPGTTNFYRDMALIRVSGDNDAVISGIRVSGAKLSNTPGRAIAFYFANNFIIENCEVDLYRYAGISLWSSSEGFVNRNKITRGRSHSSVSHNCYGISVSSSPSGDLPTRSRDITVSHNTVIDNPDWEGVETHSGFNISFLFNTIKGVHRSISLNAHSGESGGGPRDCRVIGNYIDASGASRTIFPDPGVIGISFNGGTNSRPDAIITHNTILNTEFPIRYRAGHRTAYNTDKTIVRDNVTNFSRPVEVDGTSWDSDWQSFATFGTTVTGWTGGDGEGLQIRIIREGNRSRILMSGQIQKLSSGGNQMGALNSSAVTSWLDTARNRTIGYMIGPNGVSSIYITPSRGIWIRNSTGSQNGMNDVFVNAVL